MVPQTGALCETDDPFEPYRLLDAAGQSTAPVAAFLRDLQARGLSQTTQRSYAMALLRWFRFLAAVGVGWDQAARVKARDFSRWVQIGGKPVRRHWRGRDEAVETQLGPSAAGRGRGSPNPVTGKTPPGLRYAAATAAHSETVLRGFYQFHLEAGTGPMVNPFPLSRTRRGGRANAHHNPMQLFGDERSGLYPGPRQSPGGWALTRGFVGRHAV
ncbi:MAG: site-specific integrase [Actinomycetota bacterium]